MTHKTYIEIEVEVDFEATSFVPGVTSGPPEACYPDEGGEVEIVEVTYKGKPIELDEKDLKVIEEEIVNVLSKEQSEPEPDFEQDSSYYDPYY